MKHLGDIRSISGYDVPTVEVIIGGSPCQDLSVAGKRAGLDGERSGLFMEQIRLIREMRENDRANGRTDEFIRPRFMVWENVPGAFSSNGGEDFRIVLEETVRVAEPTAVIPRPPKGKWTNAGCIMGNGWSVAWRVFDAQFWGVPQRRRRIALVADFGGNAAPEILFERKSLSGNTPQGFRSWEGAAGTAEEGAHATGIGIDGYNGSVSDEAATLGQNCGMSTGRNGVMVLNDQGGDRMDVTEDVTCTLRAEAHHPPCVMGAAGFCTEHSADSRGIGYEEETSPTLRAGTVPAAVYENHITDYTAVCIGNGQADQLGMSEKVGALNCMHDQQAIMTQAVVRRLTPLECERLQGFPDGWTDIGDWTDSKGKKHKAADSPRYKALGNSIALPSWMWVLSRLNKHCKEHTMASLFDGIGGFPLIWERINGKGLCLWASEIEEFPMAITKIRFGGE